MVPQIKKILCATDLTKNSIYAAYFALDLAHKHEAEVVILHYTDPIIPDSVIYTETMRQGTETPEDDEKRSPEGEIKKRLGDLYLKVGAKINPARVNVYPISLSTRDTLWWRSSTLQMSSSVT